MDNLIIIVIVCGILAAAVGYILKAKKSGRKCIGCPDSGCGCSGNCGSCGGCGGAK